MGEVGPSLVSRVSSKIAESRGEDMKDACCLCSSSSLTVESRASAGDGPARWMP